MVVWFTGLSGSGKSTLCRELKRRLTDIGAFAKVLDGDEMRLGLCENLQFSLKDRIENIRRIAHVAKLFSDESFVVLVATISPLAKIRDIARSINPGLVEVFVSAPLEVCEERDPKSLYRKARAGLIRDLTGIDSPFEVPLDPDVICHTDRETLAESSEKVFSHIDRMRSQQQSFPVAPTLVREMELKGDCRILRCEDSKVKHTSSLFS